MATHDESDHSDLLTAAEVAAIFRVDAKTVATWARRGRLAALRTSVGHLRFPTAEVRELLSAEATTEEAPARHDFADPDTS